MALLVLGGLAFAAVAVFLTVALVGTLVHVAIRLVLLPLLLLKWIIVGTVMLVVGPVLFLAGLVAFVAVALALAVPLLPLIVVAGLIWMIVKANRRPVAA